MESTPAVMYCTCTIHCQFCHFFIVTFHFLFMRHRHGPLLHETRLSFDETNFFWRVALETTLPLSPHRVRLAMLQRATAAQPGLHPLPRLDRDHAFDLSTPRLLDLRALQSRISLPFDVDVQADTAGGVGDDDDDALGRWAKNKRSASTAKLIGSLVQQDLKESKDGRGQRLADHLGEASGRAEPGPSRIPPAASSLVSWDSLRDDVRYARFLTDTQRGYGADSQLDEAVVRWVVCLTARYVLMLTRLSSIIVRSLGHWIDGRAKL